MKSDLIKELFLQFEQACENAGQQITNHFRDVTKMVEIAIKYTYQILTTCPK
jgi:hypothetical protein